MLLYSAKTLLETNTNGRLGNVKAENVCFATGMKTSKMIAFGVWPSTKEEDSAQIVKDMKFNEQ